LYTLYFFIRELNRPPYFLFIERNHLLSSPLILVVLRLADVKTQTLRIKIHLVLGVLQNLCDALRVVELPQIDVGPRLLDGVTNELGGSGLTLGADNGGLLLLAGLVDDEGGALGVLLSDLLGFDGGGELGGESEMLGYVSLPVLPKLDI
jgi:hypothetical protein